MSERSSENGPLGSEGSAPLETIGNATRNHLGRRKRRSLRIVIGSLASLFALAVVAVVGGYAYLNHLAGGIPRMYVAHLATAVRPAGGPSGAMNVVLAGQDGAPGSNTPSGLIEILHLNASQTAGGTVSIHPFTLVHVPGHGVTRIQNALVDGGPALLVQTLTRLTHLPINHYARIDLPHVANVVDTIHGVDVPTSSGLMHFNGAAALAWARDASISQFDRVLRQEVLLRAVMRKLLHDHLLTNPATMVPVLHSIISMLTVDSNFSTSELVSLAKVLGSLSSQNATFVIAPFTHAGGNFVFLHRASHELGTALRQDALAAWAMKFPQWRVPAVAP